MNNRENAMAILNYEKFDAVPVVHFGYWIETIKKWEDEGHIKAINANCVYDGSENEKIISNNLGFDFNWYNCLQNKTSINPQFERKVIKKNEDGSTLILNNFGVTEYHTENAGSIPAEVDHILKDRESYIKYFLPKLKYSEDRINYEGIDRIKNETARENPLGLHLGSLYGEIRNWFGIEGISYVYADDEELYGEIITQVGELCYDVAKTVLDTGIKFDFAHFWEDICFKNGPLVSPNVFKKYVGPHYKKITDMVKGYGINIISLDCDGLIDSLIDTWFENGINTMFPIEVGTWNASIEPWREKYGKELRGVGGMNKTVFARDYKAVDEEIERLKYLVDLGGYIPCPDHRIAPDAIWENVQYYCDKFRKTFN